MKFMQDYLNKVKIEADKICSSLAANLLSLHSTRATPALVEDIKVNAYGTMMPLKQVASISAPDPKTIVIQPWDSALLKDIQKSIEQSQVGAAPVADKNFIRIIMPQLSEERRREIEKIINKKVEEARVAIRRLRDDIKREIQAAEKKKEISEDERFKFEDKLQKSVDEQNARIADIQKNKIEELYR